MPRMPDVPQLPGVTHEWIDADGLRTHVALAGPHDAPPLLLVHGWPQHWYAWRHVIAALAGEYRIVAPDLRGHGWTDAPRTGYEKEQLASDQLALLDALGLERVIWAGHDWGAWAGMLAALKAPERVERLVAMCIPPPFSTRRDPRTLALALGYQGPISTPGLGSFIVRNGFAGQLLRRGRARGEFSREEVAIYDDVFRARPHVTVAMYRTFLTREALGVARGRYASQVLSVPTEIVVGDRDLITRAVRPGAYPEQPNVTVTRIDGVGHFLLEEDPDAAVAAIRRG